MPTNRVVVIGSGFAGLAASCCMAKAGYQVTVLEKNESAGGRARLFRESGFTFDMGPSWYWMPGVFEDFFGNFGSSVSDHYQLQRLDPAYQMIFSKHDRITVPASYPDLINTFEQIEPGSGEKLTRFLEQARVKYETGMQDLVYQPSHTLWEFVNLKILKGLFSLDIFRSFDSHVRKYFKHPKLIQLLSFPILFLGASAQETPALYSLMNYADLKLGTWYPQGGMHQIVAAMVKLANNLGVTFHYRQEVTGIRISDGVACEVETAGERWPAEVVLAAADYQHVDTKLIPPSFRNYSQQYWDQRVLAPSSLIFYLGLNRSLPGLLHHNLFFDEDLSRHSEEIYKDPKWPSKPLFYVSATSKTDSTVCPPGHENVFVLIPVAPDLEDNEATREKYYQLIMSRMEKILGLPIASHVIYKRSYAHRDFISDYHAFKGNAYGLANTLRQTAILKPKIRSKKVKNLFFTGQLTVPGPGVPPSLISGQVVAREIAKYLQNQ